MNAVVIFDVDKEQDVVIQKLIAMGYHKSWAVLNSNNTPNKVYNLPHNVVWKPNIESKDAMSDLEFAIDQINVNKVRGIVLLRCVILNSTPWLGIEGVK